MDDNAENRLSTACGKGWLDTLSCLLQVWSVAVKCYRQPPREQRRLWGREMRCIFLLEKKTGSHLVGLSGSKGNVII